MPKTHKVVFGAGIQGPQAYLRQIDDGAIPTDVLSRSFDGIRSFSDSPGLSDTNTRVNRFATETDINALTDAVSPNLISPGTFPKVVSVNQEPFDANYAAACQRTMTYGFNGIVRYINGTTIPSWDANLQNMASLFGNEPIMLQYTFKLYNSTGIRAVINNLPPAWKPLAIFNFYQEPGPDFPTQANRATYRQTVTNLANDIRALGNPVRLPWLEFQEFTLKQMYEDNNYINTIGDFIPPVGDFEGILWSFFEYGEDPTIPNLTTKVGHVTRAMSEFAPTKIWGIMASAYTLNVPVGGPYSDANLQKQRDWLLNSYSQLRSAGMFCWGWYNRYFNTGGSADGESRVELNPYTANIVDGLN